MNEECFDVDMDGEYCGDQIDIGVGVDEDVGGSEDDNDDKEEDGDSDDDDGKEEDGSDGSGSDYDDNDDEEGDGDDDAATTRDKHRKRQPTITVEGSNRYVKVLEAMGMYKYFNQIIKGEIRMNSASNSRAIVDRVACFLAYTFGSDQRITSAFIINCMKRIAIKKHNSINAYCQYLLNRGYAPSEYIFHHYHPRIIILIKKL